MRKPALALGLLLAACNSFTPASPDAHPGGTVDSGVDGALDAPLDATPDAAIATIALDADSHDFGDVVAGQHSGDATFVVTDSSDGATGTLAVTLDDHADFTLVSDGCDGQVLAGHAFCDIVVEFSPGSAGDKSGRLSIDPAGGGALGADLTGHGLAPGDLAFVVTDPAVFGDAPLTTATAAQALVVVNTGQAATGTLAVTLPDPAFEKVDDGCSGATLAPASTCTIDVRFHPTAVGAVQTSITVGATPGGDTARSLTGAGTARVTVTRTGSGSGGIASTPTGIDCGATCDAPFRGDVTLAATPDAVSTFVGWSGGCSGSGACTIALAADTAVTARFEGPQALTVAATGDGTGTIAGAGISCGADCTESYAFGQQVQLTATAAAGSTFAGWGGACSGNGTCTVTMDQARNVTAGFTAIETSLTVDRLGNGGGVVTSSRSINCGTTCSETIRWGDSVTLTATPATGSVFTGWTGGCTGTGPCTLTMSNDTAVHATFTLQQFTLAVQKLGNGTGTVSATGIDCGTDCSETYDYNTPVVLSATAAAGATFTGWSAPCSGTGACSVTMDQARTISATFTLDQHTLTVTRTGNGSVQSQPAGISCGATCTATFNYPTPVALTATAATGATFTGWTGACSGTGACTVTLDADRTVGATFTPTPEQLTVTKSGGGTGTVTSTPTGIDCGATCAHAFDYSTPVTLTPSAANGSLFAGWTGACSGTGACVVTMDAAKTVQAEFDVNPDLTLTVIPSGTGTGTVTGGGISCGTLCSKTFPPGTTVSLSAVAATGSTFAGWGGACAGTGTCSVTLDAAKSVVATFNLLPETMTVTLAGNAPGSVTSSLPGINCGTDCTETYSYGDSVTLTATSGPGINLVWSGACAGSASTCLVSMTQARAVTATFTYQTEALAVTRSGTGSGTVTSVGGAINCGTACGTTVNYGTTVTLTASPSVGSSFTGWSGACTGSGTTCTVTLNAAASVDAQFTLNTYTLTLTDAGSGGGSVTSSPAGLSCGASTTCTHDFDYNTPVTLTATVATGSSFAGWGGACTGTGTCSVTMSAAKSVTATFNTLQETLTVTKSGSGSGTVTSNDTLINCGSNCSATYNYGTPVILSAAVATGSSFAGWSGGGCSGTGTCTVTMTAAKTVTATFNPIPETLTVTRSGNGSGTVSGGGINCGSTCQASESYGTPVTLTATAATGSTFTGWGGACSGTGSCSVTMTAAKSVTATFTLNTYTLNVTKGGSGTGTVSGGAINCGATCTETANYGTQVTLTATASTPSSTFAGWSGGGCSGTSTCLVTIDAAKTVTATFNLVPESLTVTKNGSGTGTVIGGPINCGATCTGSGSYGVAVTLTATATTPGSTFAGWSGGGCSGIGTCTVPMTATTTVTAMFNLVPETLTVTKNGSGTGTVSGGTISCGATCTETANYGTTVTLTATATTPSSTFAGWGGACSGTGSCTVTLNGTVAVTATFNLVPESLTVVVSGNGGGSVSSAPSGIACPGTCAHSYNYGQSVTLTATPGTGSHFDGWSGACSGTSTCTVPMTTLTSVGATFTLDTESLGVLILGNDELDARVYSTPAALDCYGSGAGTCSTYVNYGTIVTVHAVVPAGATFTGWAGAGSAINCSGTSLSCSFVLNAAALLSAKFQYTDTITVNDDDQDGTGSYVDIGAPVNDSCGGLCSYSIADQTSVTFTAVKATGTQFMGWSGACTGTALSCTVNVTGNIGTTASFCSTADTCCIHPNYPQCL